MKFANRRNVQSTVLALTLGIFTAVPVVLAQVPPVKRDPPPPGWSQGQINKFNQLGGEALSLMQKQKWEDARIAYEQLCKLCPGVAESHYNLGIICMRLGKDQEALQQFQEAVAIAPDDPRAAANFANYFLAHGDISNGRLWLQKSIAVARPTDSAMVSTVKAMLTQLSQPSHRMVEGEKNSSDYFDDLSRENALFRWSKNAIPLKIFFESAFSNVHYYRVALKSILIDAFDDWVNATNGRLSWIEVHNKNNANIVCTWKDKADSSLLEGGQVKPIDEDSDGIIDHAIITLFIVQSEPVTGTLVPMSDALTKEIYLHEVGHAFGLAAHSSNHEDIMFYRGSSGPPKTKLSMRDKNTIERLYEDYPSIPKPN